METRVQREVLEPRPPWRIRVASHDVATGAAFLFGFVLPAVTGAQVPGCPTEVPYSVVASLENHFPPELLRINWSAIGGRYQIAIRDMELQIREYQRALAEIAAQPPSPQVSEFASKARDALKVNQAVLNILRCHAGRASLVHGTSHPGAQGDAAAADPDAAGGASAPSPDATAIEAERARKEAEEAIRQRRAELGEALKEVGRSGPSGSALDDLVDEIAGKKGNCRVEAERQGEPSGGGTSASFAFPVRLRSSGLDRCDRAAGNLSIDYRVKGALDVPHQSQVVPFEENLQGGIYWGSIEARFLQGALANPGREIELIHTVMTDLRCSSCRGESLAQGGASAPIVLFDRVASVCEPLDALGASERNSICGTASARVGELIRDWQATSARFLLFRDLERTLQETDGALRETYNSDAELARAVLAVRTTANVVRSTLLKLAELPGAVEDITTLGAAHKCRQLFFSHAFERTVDLISIADLIQFVQDPKLSTIAKEYAGCIASTLRPGLEKFIPLLDAVQENVEYQVEMKKYRDIVLEQSAALQSELRDSSREVAEAESSLGPLQARIDQLLTCCR